MENRAHAIAAGLFLLLLGLALAGVVAWFQGDRVQPIRHVVVSRTGVAGLNLKAPVKLRGVEVGKVEAIGFDPADPRQVLITIAVDPGAPITRGTVAKLALQGITGLSFVDLQDGDDNTALLSADGPGQRIELRPTLFDQLQVAGPELVAGLAESVRRLNTLLNDHNQEQLARSLEALGGATEHATKLLASLQPAAAALPGLVRHADSFLAGADGVVRRLDTLAARADTLAADADALTLDLRQRVAVIDRLGAAAGQIESSTRQIELSLVGVTPQRNRPLLEDLSAASRAVERAVDSVGEQPQSLLFGRGAVPPGPGEAGFTAAGAAR